MPSLTLLRITALLGLIACAGILPGPRSASADSLRLLTDLEYEVTDSTTTEKATGLRYEDERTVFSQLYSLDIQKELLPNLKVNFGGLFDQDDTDNTTTEPGSQDSDAKNTTTRPYIDLQLDSPLLRAMTGYRKNEIKRIASFAETTRAFMEEYSASLNWEPVDWPEVDFDFSRTLSYDDPLTYDQRVDDYLLQSRYNYQDFRFTYSHNTNEALNKLTDFETMTNTDNGSVRFSRTYQQGTVAVNSSLRGRREVIEFSGEGARLVPTTSAGTIIGNAEDPFPLTSDPDPSFNLNDIDLLVDSLLEADQLSFGLDFGGATDVDRLFIDFVEVGNYHSNDFTWQVYVRDNDTEDWTEIRAVQDSTNLAEGRFELAFPPVKPRYIKIVTRPLAPPTVPSGENLIIREIIGQRTLPEDTSEFTTTDWTGDLSVNWQHTDRTATGYDVLYREQRSKPLDEKRTLLSTGVRLNHQFNDMFVGNMRLQRTENRERGEGTETDYNYSAALAAHYLETFNQTLTYSYNHRDDEDEGTSTANAVLLRSNFDLYEGWSLYLDTGHSWQDPGDGAKTNSTFIRTSSNIVPSRWLNLTLSYGISWNEETDMPDSREQDGRLVITWVPTAAFSLSADLAFSDETGEDKDSTVTQQYFLNWSPFRDGTLMLSVGYGYLNDDNDDEEKSWSLSPILRWQVNRKTQLTLEYALGEREDLTETVEFENISLALRFFY